MKTINLLYKLAGLISLGLGIAGVGLPLLPTVPFVLLSCFCFSKGSPGFHKVLTSSKFYNKYLTEYVRTKAMTLKTKLSICVTATILIGLTIVFSTFLWIHFIIVCLLLFKWYYFFFKIKTAKEDSVIVLPTAE